MQLPHKSRFILFVAITVVCVFVLMRVLGFATGESHEVAVQALDVAAVILLVVAILSEVQHMVRATRSDGVVAMLQWVQNDEVRRARTALFENAAKLRTEKVKAGDYSEVDPQLIKDARLVASRFAELGQMLYCAGALDRAEVLPWWATSVTDAWSVLEPIVRHDATKFCDAVRYVHFEALVQDAKREPSPDRTRIIQTCLRSGSRH